MELTNPWISQIKYQDPATGFNLASPSMVKLDTGELLASYDYQWSGDFPKTENKDKRGYRETEGLPEALSHHEDITDLKLDQYITSVYRSDDDGLTWELTGDIKGSTGGKLFVNRGSAYLISNLYEYGSLVIRRSDDKGSTWTDPVDEDSGFLFRAGKAYEPPNYHHVPSNVLKFEGRLYTAYENNDPWHWPKGLRAFVLSADEESDLLKASSWRKSNEVVFPGDPAGRVDGWMEGNIVVDSDGQLCSVMRIQPVLDGDARRESYMSGKTKYAIDKAAFLKIENEGRQLVNDPERWCVDLPGAMSKFTIFRDDIGGRYWLIANDMFTGPPRVHRNILSLFSSEDLSSWIRHKVLMEDRHEKTPEASTLKTGFQYADWQFDGDDIIYVVRTAYKGAPNYHDANRITFGRVEDFRKFSQSGELWHSDS